MAVGDGAVWVANSSDGTLSQIDAITGAVAAWVRFRSAFAARSVMLLVARSHLGLKRRISARPPAGRLLAHPELI